MIHATTLLCVVIGFAALCASRHRHQRDLFGRPLSHRRGRAAGFVGWGLIGVALLLAMAGLGWARGLIVWTGCLSVGALASMAMLNRIVARKHGRAG